MYAFMSISGGAFLIRKFCRGNWLAEEMGSRKGTEVASDWARRAGEMTGEKCTSFDDLLLLPCRISGAVVSEFSLSGEKFSLSESSAGVGSNAIDGDFRAILVNPSSQIAIWTSEARDTE